MNYNENEGVIRRNKKRKLQTETDEKFTDMVLYVHQLTRKGRVQHTLVFSGLHTKFKIGRSKTDYRFFVELGVMKLTYDGKKKFIEWIGGFPTPELIQKLRTAEYVKTSKYNYDYSLKQKRLKAEKAAKEQEENKPTEIQQPTLFDQQEPLKTQNIEKPKNPDKSQGVELLIKIHEGNTQIKNGIDQLNNRFDQLITKIDKLNELFEDYISWAKMS